MPKRLEPEQDEANENGDLPPLGCKKPGKGLPQVSVPKNKEHFEHAFLIEKNRLERIVTPIILDSVTLVAWFTLKLPQVRQTVSGSSNLPQWNQVWTVIEEQKAMLEEQYDSNESEGSLATQWELKPPVTLNELYAYAMYVLFRKASEDPGEDEGLKWHKYYYEDEGKFYLIYQFLNFLSKYSTGLGAMQFDRPSESTHQSAHARWPTTGGGKIRTAADKFFSSEVSTRRMAIVMQRDILIGLANDWDPRNLLSSGTGKEVGFVLNEDTNVSKTLTQDVKELLQAVQTYEAQHPGDDATLCEVLCAILWWPSCVTITGVSTRDNDDNEISLETLGDFEEFVRKDKEPWIWLKTSSVGGHGLILGNHEDYSGHPTLELERLVDRITEHEAKDVASLFSLIRSNHRCSSEFVEDLIKIFAPVKQRNDMDFERASSLLRIFQNWPVNNEDPFFQLEGLEGLVADLDEELAEDARAVLRLVRKGYGNCSDNADELNTIFEAKKARNAEMWTRADQIKNIFEAIDDFEAIGVEADNMEIE